MENKKKISFLIMAIALVLIAFIVWFVINLDKKTEEAPISPGGDNVSVDATDPVNSANPGNMPRDYRKFDISKEPVLEQDAEAVKKIAMAFAERFGSFSNQSNYSNIEDLRIFMTTSMGDWAEGYLAKLKEEKSNNGDYYGIITKAISAEVEEFDKTKGTAKIVITNRRQETNGRIASDYYNQELTLNMAKEDGAWKADSAIWQK